MFHAGEGGPVCSTGHCDARNTHLVMHGVCGEFYTHDLIRDGIIRPTSQMRSGGSAQQGRLASLSSTWPQLGQPDRKLQDPEPRWRGAGLVRWRWLWAGDSARAESAILGSLLSCGPVWQPPSEMALLVPGLGALVRYATHLQARLSGPRHH